MEARKNTVYPPTQERHKKLQLNKFGTVLDYFLCLYRISNLYYLYIS